MKAGKWISLGRRFDKEKPNKLHVAKFIFNIIIKLKLI
jgi:hypothetical protein